MKNKFATLVLAALMTAIGSRLSHAALAQIQITDYNPVGIAVTPGIDSDYVFVVWKDQVRPSNFIIDEYQYTTPYQDPGQPQGAFLQAESATMTLPSGYTFAGITGGYNSSGAYFNPTAYLAFQYAPSGVLLVEQLSVVNGSGPALPPSYIPLQTIVPTLTMVSRSQLSNMGLPITVSGMCEDNSGNLTFMSQLGGTAAGFESWTPNGQPLGDSAVGMGTSQAGGPTGSCTGYVVAPDTYGRCLFWNAPSDTLILDKLLPINGGFSGIVTQPAMQTPVGSNWFPVSVSATNDEYYGPITQVLWDGVTSTNGVNSAMVWNFIPGATSPSSQQTWALPAGSVTVGMAADNNDANRAAFVLANYMGIQGASPNYDGCTYVLATYGVNAAMLYQVPVGVGAGSGVVGSLIRAAG